MNVSDAVKEQYKNNSIHKNLILSFPELDLQITHKAVSYTHLTLPTIYSV